MVRYLTGAATLAAAVTTAVLLALDHHSWRVAFAVALAMLGVRMMMLAWSAARGELPWLRLLLPGIVMLEGAGVAWSGSTLWWYARLATAVVLELAFVAVAIRALRRSAAGDEPPEARIARAIGALLPPRAARLVAFELVIVALALRFASGGWRRAVPVGFTYHRESGLRMLLPMLPLLGIGDLLLLELVLLPDAAPWIRAVVHGLAFYSLIWLVGLYASARARPHRLAHGRLVLHRGLLGRLDVAVDQIASIGELPSFTDDWKKRAYCKGALRLDLAGPPVLELRLHTAARRIGVLGEGAPGTRLLVAVDDPAAFTAALAR